MTTSPDTVHAAEATTDPARLTAQPAAQATSPAIPAPAGTVGGTVDPTATRTRVRPTRPDFAEEKSSEFERFLVGVFVAVLRGYELRDDDAIHGVRMVRAALHGFVSLEREGGFAMPIELQESYQRLVRMLDRGLGSRG